MTPRLSRSFPTYFEDVMRSRSLLSAAFALAVLVAWKFPAAPAPKHYRIQMKMTQVVDLTPLGQTEQRQSLGSVGFVTVTLADTADGKTITILLDSLQPDSGSPIPAEAAKAASGITWHGLVGPNGRISGLKSDSDNIIASQMSGIMREFLPPVPAGTQAGKSWTDTTENTDNVNNGSMAVRTVTNFQSSSETYAGVKAVKIASASSSSVSGTQETGSGSATIEGTGTGSGTWYIAPDGSYLGGTRNGTQNLAVSGSFAPEPLPVTVTIESTTAILK